MKNTSIPRILNDWLEDTEQFSRGAPLSDSHLLAEAEWCLYCIDASELGMTTGMWDDYHPASKAALKRYVERQRGKGIEPKHDFDL